MTGKGTKHPIPGKRGNRRNTPTHPVRGTGLYKAIVRACCHRHGKGVKPALPCRVTVTPVLWDEIGGNMKFFMAMKPPTSTSQMKKVRVVNGKPVFYDPPQVKEARQMITAALMPHRPKQPLAGALSLYSLWLYPRGKSHKDGQWRTTRPDTDNIQKLLKDCMTKAGFWEDYAQVAREVVEKRWSDEPCGIYIEIEEMEGGTP